GVYGERQVIFIHPADLKAMNAEAAGVSSRALETGFRAFRGTSPAVYLLTLRLRAARKDLLDPESKETMKAICLKWGFFHF
ncbi:helix-turn-helix domain-containing protein, partial [Rhizobium ruizarguesonis]